MVVRPRGRSCRPSGCMRARIPCASCGVQAAYVRARFMCTRRTFALVCPPSMWCVQQARPSYSECVLGHTSAAGILVSPRGLAQLNAEARSSGKTAKRRAERTSSCGTSVTAAGAFATFTCSCFIVCRRVLGEWRSLSSHCVTSAAAFLPIGQSRRSCWPRTPPSSTLLTSASALVTAPIANMWPSTSTRPTGQPSLSVARPPSTTSAASSDCPNALQRTISSAGKQFKSAR